MPPRARARNGTRVAAYAAMLWSLFVSSLILWAFGVVSAHTAGGRIHVLLAVAIAVIVVRIIQAHRDRIA